MKFLCLHGSGTNNRIFELQTAALRNELGDEHIYEFVEGVVACNVFPTIEALAMPNEKFFKYYEEGSQDSFLKALADIDRYIELEGPFDAVLAFSQGSTVAAGYTMQMQIRKHVQMPFACAIFIAGSARLDGKVNTTIHEIVAEERNEGSSGGLPISIPTTHIWGTGEADPAIPKELHDSCVSHGCHLLVFDGGHEVPGAGNSTALTGAARLIRKMISYVEEASRSRV